MNTSDDDVTVRKFGISVRVSRETAIEHGLIEPTPEERAARRADLGERTITAWRIYREALHAFALIRNPVARMVLELHAPTEGAWPRCQGCEYGGMDAEEPDWPCATVSLIAEHFAIELPTDAHLLWSKPEEPTR